MLRIISDYSNWVQNELEKKTNRCIEDRQIKKHHGLILRNRIEERENDIRGYAEE